MAQHPAHGTSEVDPTFMVDAEVAALRSKQQAVEAKLAEVRQQEHALAEQLERLAAALAALTGKSGKPSPKASGKTAYTTAEVAELVAAILKRDGPLAEAELKAKLDEQAQRGGRNRSGLHLRLKDALKNQRFAATDNGWKLA